MGEVVDIRTPRERPSFFCTSSTSIASTSTTTTAAAATGCLPGLGNVALDGPAAHLLPLHRLDGCVRLRSACKCDEGKSSARVVSVSDCAVLTKGFIEVICGSLLGPVSYTHLTLPTKA